MDYNKEKFEKHIQYISSYGCKVVLLEDLLDLSTKINKKDKLVVLTFDDGHESCFWNAFPILEKYGYKAEFFVTAGFIGQKGYMSEEQLKELKKHGMSIQSHSFSHKFMSSLDKKDMFFEIQESKEKLSNILESDVDFFAYPGGRYNDLTESVVRESGYKGSCTSDVGYNQIGNGLFSLKRFHYIDGMKDSYF